MKLEVERGSTSGRLGGDLAVRFEKGADERVHGKEIGDARKPGADFCDEDLPPVRIPPEKHFGNSHKDIITYWCCS